MRMRVDEINAAGGIHGRKLRLVVEDHGYDPKKAVLAAQKMVQQDKIFAALGSIGTPTAMAAMPIYLDNKVAHLFPLTGAREMFEPLHQLKYSFAAPYFDQIRAGIKRLVKDKGLKKVCTLYQDDDFGLEVMRGAEAGPEGHRHDLRRAHHLQARRDRLLLAGRQDEGRRLRRRRDGHDHPRDHRRDRHRAASSTGIRTSSAPRRAIRRSSTSSAARR